MSSRYDQVFEHLLGKLSGSVSRRVHMQEESNWRIGGYAELVADVENEADIATCLRACRDASIQVITVGLTSNLLFDSHGYRGMIIRVGPLMSKITREGNVLDVGAGCTAKHLANAALEAGLTGLEHIVGIPGSLGGLLVMNGGSKRHSISESVQSVRGVMPDGERVELGREMLGFAHRRSELGRLGVTVTGARLSLAAAPKSEISSRMNRILEERAGKFPLAWPNGGSTFISDPAVFRDHGAPGALIERAGLKGHQVGGARISTQHANFFVNVGDASSDDVLALIKLARDRVRTQFGVQLQSEVKFVHCNGQIMAAHDAAESVNLCPPR